MSDERRPLVDIDSDDGLEGMCPDFDGSSSEDDFGYNGDNVDGLSLPSDECLVPSGTIVLKVDGRSGISAEILAESVHNVSLDGVIVSWFRNWVHTPPTQADETKTTSILVAVVVAETAQSRVCDAVTASEDVEKSTCLLTAPCPVPFDRIVVKDIVVSATTAVHIDRASDNDEAVTSSSYSIMFEKYGLLMIPSALKSELIAAVKDEALKQIHVAESRIIESNPDIELGTTLFSFAEIGSRGGHRFDLLLDLKSSAASRCSKIFRPLVARLLKCNEDEMHCQASVVYSRPGAPNQDWHSDGDHIQNDAGWSEIGNPAVPYAVCVFVPLIDLDRSKGFTQFWPCSHKYKQLLGFGSSCNVLGAEFDGIGNAGDAIIYDYRLLHRGMANTSSVQRELVQFLFSVPWYREQKNYGKKSIFD